MSTNITRSKEKKQQELEKFVHVVERECLCQNIKTVEPVANVALQNFHNN